MNFNKTTISNTAGLLVAGEVKNLLDVSSIVLQKEGAIIAVVAGLVSFLNPYDKSDKGMIDGARYIRGILDKIISDGDKSITANEETKSKEANK